MATNTYVALQTVTLSSTLSSITLGVGGTIPQNYTDLRLVITGVMTGTNDLYMGLGNGSIDTGANYSNTILIGNSATPASSRGTNLTLGISVGGWFSGLSSSNTVVVVDLLNYSNTTTYKTVLARNSDPALNAEATVGLWRSTSAINIIKLQTNGAANFASGTNVTLYGIASSDVPAYATGGYVSSDSTYWYHAFPMSGTFTPKQALTADILVVAGGAGGGNMYGGGGGAGGLLVQSGRSLTSGTAYTCTIGAGGAANSNSTSVVGNSGSNSVFDTSTALGGGGGGTFNTIAGVNGGSGGGGPMGATNGGSYGAGGSATQGNSGGATGYGNAGGQGYRVNPAYLGGGGGGAGGAGGTATGTTAGIGGTGFTSALVNAMGAATGFGQLSGGNYYFAGGGGGGAESATPNSGGLGGGGRGGLYGSYGPDNGLPNTGGGGGAVGGNLATGSAGGSGLIIVRYPK